MMKGDNLVNGLMGLEAREAADGVWLAHGFLLHHGSLRELIYNQW
jgi:hypothetical protein